MCRDGLGLGMAWAGIHGGMSTRILYSESCSKIGGCECVVTECGATAVTVSVVTDYASARRHHARWAGEFEAMQRVSSLRDRIATVFTGTPVCNP